MNVGKEILRPVIRRMMKARVFLKRLPVPPVPSNAITLGGEPLTLGNQTLTFGPP